MSKSIESVVFESIQDDETAVCPYCGYREDEPQELESGEVDCANCCMRFYLSIEARYSYTTEPMEALKAAELQSEFLRAKKEAEKGRYGARRDLQADA